MVTQAHQRKYPPPSVYSVKHRSSVVWELTAWEKHSSLVKYPSPTVKASLSQTDSLKVKHSQSGPDALTDSFHSPVMFVRSPVSYHKTSGKAAVLEAV